MRSVVPIALLAGLLLAGLLAGSAAAGTRIVTETRRLDRDGATPERAEVRIDGDRLRFDDPSGRTSVIYRADRELAWWLDHREKKFVEVSRGSTAAVARKVDETNTAIRKSLEGLPPERRAALEGLLDGTLGPPPGAEPEVSLRPTGERDLVEGIPCDEHEVVRGTERVALLCAAQPDALGLAPGDRDVLRRLSGFLRETVESISRLAPGAVRSEGVDALAAVDRLDGVPVRVRAFDDGRAVSETLVTEVVTEDVDPARFERPEGYRGGFSLDGLGAVSGGGAD
jgi:hypothetical protein